MLSGTHDVKVIAIGDGHHYDFEGVQQAYNRYLGKQNKHILNRINTSLHRIKFVSTPTIKQLTKELRCITWDIQDIVEHNHISKDYVLRQRNEKIITELQKNDRLSMNYRLSFHIPPIIE